MKINNEIDIEPFIGFTCPYCYNVREVDANYFEIETGKITIWCDVCRRPIVLEMFIPKQFVKKLGMDSGHLRICNDY